MCMLSYFPEGKMPQESHLVNGAELNPDGHGYAIVTGDRHLMVHRGMDSAEMIDRFLTAREKHMDGPALFHSRIATSGLVDITGCHPFKVGSDNRTVVAHNGILFDPGKTSEKSDTAIFAETMLPRFGSLDSPKRFHKLEKFTGSSKLVILTVNPARRRTSYLVNASAGIWVDGQWHSNYDYEGAWWREYDDYYTGGKVFTYGAGSTGKPKALPYGRSVFPCDVCGETGGVDMTSLVCNVCGSCNDCHQDARLSCMCFTPRRERTSPLVSIGGGTPSS